MLAERGKIVNEAQPAVGQNKGARLELPFAGILRIKFGGTFSAIGADNKAGGKKRQPPR
jgi:hypothetical protein